MQVQQIVMKSILTTLSNEQRNIHRHVVTLPCEINKKIILLRVRLIFLQLL